MGYIIQYDPEKNAQYPAKTPKSGHVGLYLSAVIFTCVMLGLAVKYRSSIQDWLVPGNAEVTTAAFQTLTDDVRNGKPAGEAITAFCKEIIAHATE